VTEIEYWYGDIELCNTVPKVISAYEVSRTDQNHMTNNVLHCSIFVSNMINLFIFVGNWDILTLLVMGDIIYFMLVTACGINVMYGVMFILVADLVVCIYVMYL